MSKARVLYLSYDGLTDPLGQSQVLPYLIPLSQDYHIQIISCEKPERFAQNKKTIEELISGTGISWNPITYHKSPPIFSTLWDLRQMERLARRLHKDSPFAMVHCRSHLTALLGDKLKRDLGIKFLFDMRSFFADERADSRLWDQEKAIYKKVYEFFKKKEVDFLTNADHTVALTTKAKEILGGWKLNNPSPITVIPCCADLSHFSQENLSRESQDKWRQQLQIPENATVISYLGSIGTWYLPEDMLKFFAEFKEISPEAIFLFITPDTQDVIYEHAKTAGVERSSIRVISASRVQVPELLSLSDYNLFFIMPTFSKQASSPTKLAEVMGLGIPVIANAGVGDVDQILSESGAGTLIEEMNKDEYKKAISKLPNTENFPREQVRSYAEEHFSLKTGLQRYRDIYSSLLE